MKRNPLQQKPSEKMMGPSRSPLKYSSAGTRYASLQNFMQGAEFNEVNASPCKMPGETDNDWWGMNIRSGQNMTDCPHEFGMDKNRGMDRIGTKVITPESIISGWIRFKGEPVK